MKESVKREEASAHNFLRKLDLRYPGRKCGKQDTCKASDQPSIDGVLFGWQHQYNYYHVETEVKMEFINQFLEMEEKEKLFDYTYKDFYYWESIRNSVYEHINNKLNKLTPAQSVTKKLNLKVAYQLLRNLIKRSPFNLKKAPILVLSHPRRIKNEDGLYECIYTDFITLTLGADKVNVLEGYYDGFHVGPTCIDGIYYSDIINYICALKHKLNNRKVKKKILSKEAQNIKNIIYLIKKYIGFDFSEDLIINIISKDYTYFVQKQIFYMNMLRKSQTKIIVEVVGYNHDSKLFNYCAKKLKIPTFELQHGLIGRNTIDYNFPTTVDSKFMADVLFLYSTYECETLSLAQNIKAVPVGFPFLEMKKDDYTLRYKKSQPPTILFVSQGTIGKKLSRFAVELYNYLIENNLDFQIVYKLHPGEFDIWKREYEALYKLSDKITVIHDMNYHIYKFFAEASIQIGVYSTALLEGVSFGLKTYIYDIEYNDYLEMLLKLNNVKLIKKPAALLNDLKHFSDSSEMIGENEFFAKNAVDNIINKLIEAIKDEKK